MWLVLSCIAGALCYVCYWRWKHRRLLMLSRSLPGPRTLPLVGNAHMFIGKAGFLEVLADISRKYGEHFRFWIGTQFNVVVRNPHDIRLLLTSSKLNVKGPLYRTMEDIIGPGILTGGPTWRSHRKIVTPSYSKKSVQHYFDVFNKEAVYLLRDMLTEVDVFDAYKSVVDVTTQCVCQTLMGLDKAESQKIKNLQEVVEFTPKMYAMIFGKMTKWWYWTPLFQLLGHKRRQDEYVRKIREMVSDIVDRRKKKLYEQKEEGVGIVDRLILCGELSEKEVYEETFSLFTTSQEASAKIASALLLFLAYLPDWQDRVYNEMIEVMGREDRDVTEEDLRQMASLDMVYKETLRYLPIASCIQRTVEEDIALEKAGVTLPAGTSVVIPLHSLHRDPRYWTDPDEVRPERFDLAESSQRDPNAYVPFSLGPMDCLGRVFATALIKTLVVRCVRRARLRPPGGHGLRRLALDVAISTEVRGGCRLRAERRP